MKIDFVDLKVQYASISHEIDEAIRRVVAASDFIPGKDVELFAQEFADYCGVVAARVFADHRIARLARHLASHVS